jgi:predicted RNA-binding protein with PUA-like domain
MAVDERSGEEIWSQIRERAEELRATGTLLPTVAMGILNEIVDVEENRIARRSESPRTTRGVSDAHRGEILRIWDALRLDGSYRSGERRRGELRFAVALFRLVDGVSVEGGALHLQGVASRSYWVLAALPTNYRLVESVREQEEDWWRTGGRHIRRGDRVAIYKYKGNDSWRGVVGFGEVVSEPEVNTIADEDDPYWLTGGTPLPPTAERVRVRYVDLPKMTLLVDKSSPSVVNQLTVTRAQGGTAFTVTSEQWSRLVQEAGGWPRLSASDARREEALVREVVRPRKDGQAFMRSAAQRRAVELRAMAVAREYFEKHGWTCDDVSRTRPYDFHLTRSGRALIVEVKGTTGAGSKIILTSGEVEVVRGRGSEAALALVTGIRVSASNDGTPVAAAGELRVVQPWEVDDVRLSPLTFSYPIDAPIRDAEAIRPSMRGVSPTRE